MNINNFETPKLAMEPLQMKKKKKGGGFNLRKSLAWDRAFFTEEGVLDPRELSVISGASCGEELSSVNEHTPVGSPLSNKQIDMQSIKNNSLTQMRNEYLAKDTKKNGSSTSHKVPALVGCTKSTLKRPANANVGRASGKEIKLPKLPGSKSGLSPICTTNKKTIARVNHVKHDKISRPGLKSSWESLKKIQHASNSLRPGFHSDGNSGNPSYRRHSSINTSPALVDKIDSSGSNMINPVRPVHASEGQHELATFTVPLPQNALCSNRTTHPSQNQGLKPSGLRMPSPSLSFFSQTVPSVNVSVRATGSDVCGFQRHENSRVKEHLRTPVVDGRIQQVTVYGNAISSRSVCTTSSQVHTVASVEPIIEKASMRKLQDCSKENQIEKISVKEAEYQSIDNEVPSQSESQEQVMNGSFIECDSDGYPEKSESCQSGWKSEEVQSEQGHTIQESEIVLAIDESSEEKHTCNNLFLSQGATFEERLDHRVQRSLINQSDGEDACKSDCHGPHSINNDCVKYPLGKTDQDKSSLKLRESVQLDVTQKNVGWCSQSRSLDGLECRLSKSERSYLGSKDLHADLSKEASVSCVLTIDLLARQSHLQNAACDPNIRECKNSIHLISEVGNDTKQPGKGTQVLNTCPEGGMELHMNVGLNTSELPQKQICLEEQKLEKLTFLFPDRKDGNKVVDTKMVRAIDEDEIIGQTLSSTGFNSVDNYMSPEKHNNVINNTLDYDEKNELDIDYVLHDPANHNLLNCLQEGSQRTEIDYVSLSPVSSSCEVSDDIYHGKVAEMRSIIQDCSTSNQLTLSITVNENESDIDNLRNVGGSGTALMQPPKSSILNECSSQQSETLFHANYGAENLEHGHVGLHFENYLQNKIPANKHRKDNELESKEHSITEQSKINTTALKSSSIPDRESLSKHGSHEDAYGTCETHIADATRDPQRVSPLSDIADSVSSEDNKCFSSCIHPNLDAAKVESSLAPENMHGDGLNKKSCSVVLPHNALPFSDEWFAAIEAAGEDILTRKSGAVQNSPPDKSLPEPSPWSPVKKRNNQIGPFDCTKFTNNLPSGSN